MLRFLAQFQATCSAGRWSVDRTTARWCLVRGLRSRNVCSLHMLRGPNGHVTVFWGDITRYCCVAEGPGNSTSGYDTEDCFLISCYSLSWLQNFPAFTQTHTSLRQPVGSMKIHLTLCFPLHLGLPSGLLPSDFPTETLQSFLVSAPMLPTRMYPISSYL